jgi:transposase
MKLMYKARLNKQKVIKVAPQYTSQRCPHCGHIEASNRNKQTHVFCCKKCKYTSNDDRVGAMNIYELGIDFLAGNPVPKITVEKTVVAE